MTIIAEKVAEIDFNTTFTPRLIFYDPPEV